MDQQEWMGTFFAALPLTHRWQNHFHLAMPFGSTLQPAGMIFWQGAGHLFFTWMAQTDGKGTVGWLHTATRDFLRYTMPMPVLGPTLASDFLPGCITQCQDALVLWYTQQLYTAGGQVSCTQYQAGWKKSLQQDRPLSLPPLPEGYGELQNPYVFSRQDQRFLLLGAKAADGRGCALLYREGVRGWEYLGELHTQLGKFGSRWEEPQLVNLGDRDVLFFCPQGVAPQEYAYQNLYQAGYLAGKASLATQELLHGTFQELDKGFDFYAPQVAQHEGRLLLIGWMGMPHKEAQYPTAALGWRYALTMPRELRLRHGHLYAAPARELKALRIEESAREFSVQKTAAQTLPLPEGAEVLLSMRMGRAKRLTIELAYGLEVLRFIYDRERQLMQIDRMGMTNGGRGVRTFRLYSEDTLQWHFFIDKTAIEVFFQNGEQTASLQVFPEKNILPEMTLAADAELSEIAGSVWQLDSLHFS